MSTKSLAKIGAIGVLLHAFIAQASAQDPAVVNAKTITVKLENERVRVLEAILAPGDKEQLHSHPANVFYVVAGGKIRNHAADGKTTETDLQAGQVFYRDPVTHWAENIGSTTLRVILVELKGPAEAGPIGEPGELSAPHAREEQR
jgi:quercetin dioxygenase-like cupin family protein